MPLDNTFNKIALSLVSSVFILEKLIAIVYILFRNRSLRAVNLASVETYNTITKLVVTIETPWKYYPGQFVYLRIPGIPGPSFYSTRFQTHPYMLAWVSPDDGNNVSECQFLIESRRGFSKWLNCCLLSECKIQIDGPYGSMRDINNYEKVVLISDGIGLTSHLSIVQYLLNLKLSKNKTRRIDMTWFSQNAGKLTICRPRQC